MVSILDQYEQPQIRQQPQLSMTSSGFINLALEDTVPMFSKQKMNFSPSDSITHAAVANDVLVLAMANGKLFLMDLKNPDDNEEIYYTKYAQKNTKLSGIFIDPLGNHLLLALVARNKEGYPELLYLHRKSNKIKSWSKSRNYELTEVGWNYENKSDVTTGPILLGTSAGHILETEIGVESDRKSQPVIEQYWRQLPNYLPLYGGKDIDGLIFDVGKGAVDTPITGLTFHRVAGTNKYFIFATTPRRLYQFMGYTNPDERPLLQPIFNNYLNVPETGYQDIPSTLKYSKLRMFFGDGFVPESFAWLTGPGIFYGQLDASSQQNANSLFTQGKLLSYGNDKGNTTHTEKAPTNFIITEFHSLMMYSDRVRVLSLLNQELVHEDVFSDSQGKLKDIVIDHVKKTIWVVTDKSVYRYKVVKEARNVWQIFCDKGEFELAKRYCGDNPMYIDTIDIKEAEQLFSNGEYNRSAEIYAGTQMSFETICLKFLEADQTEALKIYLGSKLKSLSDEDKTLISMVVIWMIELHLSQLSQLRCSGKEETPEYSQLQSDFEIFLLQPRVEKCMQHIKPVVYDLMATHGDKQNLLKLTILNEDYENVIDQHIYRKSYLEALEVLKNVKKPDLFYQFGPILMQEAPKQTVNVFISQGPRLLPSKLLPALLSCESDAVHTPEVIRYLEYMIQNFNVKEMALHNYLLTLYTEHDVEALMRYLARQGQDLSSVNFDVHYALRLCREKKLTKACVKLSALLGLWQSAVELALTVDLDLAKTIANQPDDDDEELKKKLWLIIAEHVISNNQDMKMAMSFLEECPLIKIEDILPFFSDVVTIDHFREPICQSLQEYNNQIEDLKQEMEEATKAAEQVRAEIQAFRNRSVAVSAHDACALCDITLLLRPFYLFPCSHKFHMDCLTAHVLPSLGPARRNKLQDLQRQLTALPSRELNAPTSSGLPLKEQLRSEIDDAVASECVYCGELMIRAIDQPFIADGDWDAVMKEWE